MKMFSLSRHFQFLAISLSSSIHVERLTAEVTDIQANFIKSTKILYFLWRMQKHYSYLLNSTREDLMNEYTCMQWNILIFDLNSYFKGTVGSFEAENPSNPKSIHLNSESFNHIMSFIRGSMECRRSSHLPKAIERC